MWELCYKIACWKSLDHLTFGFENKSYKLHKNAVNKISVKEKKDSFNLPIKDNILAPIGNYTRNKEM